MTETDLESIPLLEDVVIPDAGQDPRNAESEHLRQELSTELQRMVSEAVDQAITEITPQLRQILQREIGLRFERHLTDAMRLMLDEHKP